MSESCCIPPKEVRHRLSDLWSTGKHPVADPGARRKRKRILHNIRRFPRARRIHIWRQRKDHGGHPRPKPKVSTVNPRVMWRSRLGATRFAGHSQKRSHSKCRASRHGWNIDTALKEHPRWATSKRKIDVVCLVRGIYRGNTHGSAKRATNAAYGRRRI